MEGPTFIYFDNQSVLMNASLLDSILKNKINSIVYHFFVGTLKVMSGGVEGLVPMINHHT